ncbi:uncharacterized protein MONBRDRAFT_28716 [Monosiga brevicollis MX1]|uniref:Uncharacterized protein n=1 Tax=Monosiga brevicollis TaxID=81824 RepID=A9V8Z5_MONBE|nr:uncharacterized protein MONBRDRAFT_28716 [Monosiga brevicollis MX1]EDQ86042.1 predicted protein [Monosiga brevicollis MX1]|eukprot:XP_001749236.1 hypothetical protein [Monosiga brevicollis MX1]
MATQVELDVALQAAVELAAGVTGEASSGQSLQNLNAIVAALHLVEASLNKHGRRLLACRAPHIRQHTIEALATIVAEAAPPAQTLEQTPQLEQTALLLHEEDLAAQSQAALLAWVCQATLVTRLLDAPSPEARLRIFHLYATLAGHNEACFKAVLGTGVLQAALDCYTQSDDILVQLNVVESLKLLTACDAACTWLSTPTVLDALLLPLTPKGAANPFQNMLLPVTFDFLATLAASQELDFTDWDARYGLLNAFAVAMDSSDTTILVRLLLRRFESSMQHWVLGHNACARPHCVSFCSKTAKLKHYVIVTLTTFCTLVTSSRLSCTHSWQTPSFEL